MSDKGPTHSHSESASETTSIALPTQSRPSEPSVIYTLSEDERRAVAALPEGSALLIAHTGPNQGARFLLDKDKNVAGRHPNADIFLDDVTVSRRHAAFVRDGDGFLVRDLGSLNGTYVGKDRVDESRLHAGQDVQIGKYRLTYHPFPGTA